MTHFLTLFCTLVAYVSFVAALDRFPLSQQECPNFVFNSLEQQAFSKLEITNQDSKSSFDCFGEERFPSKNGLIMKFNQTQNPGLILSLLNESFFEEDWRITIPFQIQAALPNTELEVFSVLSDESNFKLLASFAASRLLGPPFLDITFKLFENATLVVEEALPFFNGGLFLTHIGKQLVDGTPKAFLGGSKNARAFFLKFNTTSSLNLGNIAEISILKGSSPEGLVLVELLGFQVDNEIITPDTVFDLDEQDFTFHNFLPTVITGLPPSSIEPQEDFSFFAGFPLTGGNLSGTALKFEVLETDLPLEIGTVRADTNRILVDLEENKSFQPFSVKIKYGFDEPYPVFNEYEVNFILSFEESDNSKRNISIGLGVGAALIVLVALSLYVAKVAVARKNSENRLPLDVEKPKGTAQNVEALL